MPEILGAGAITITLTPTANPAQFTIGLQYTHVRGGWVAVHQALTTALNLTLQKIVEEHQPRVVPAAMVPPMNGRQ